MISYQALVDKALALKPLSRDDVATVMDSPEQEIDALLEAAFIVRKHYCGMKVHLHMLANARSGLCPEDCSYCSQSIVSKAPISRYKLLSSEELLARARRADEMRCKRFCIVCSGRGPSNRDIEKIAVAARLIRAETSVSICCSLGLMSAEQIARLREAGVERINHNLNTSRRLYPEICSTHGYDDRVATVRHTKRVGLSSCSGVIVGLDETIDDLFQLIGELGELQVDSIPVNFLQAIDGTPLEGRRSLTPNRCLKYLCLFRFAHPAKEIRVSSGRELHLGNKQILSLYAANSLFVDGYLTTPGQCAEDTIAWLTEHGFEIDAPQVMNA